MEKGTLRNDTYKGVISNKSVTLMKVNDTTLTFLMHLLSQDSVVLDCLINDKKVTLMKHKEIISFQKRMNKFRNYIFTFLYYPKVPPDNNDSEKAIRNVKVKQKVSGQCKPMDGAKIFAILRSITDIALKNGQNVLQSLNVVANLKVQTD